MTRPDKDQFSKWHNDPSNWKWGIFYVNTEDPRVWLPKRNPMMGWTLNFAHRAAYLWLLLLLAPVLIVGWLSRLF